MAPSSGRVFARGRGPGPYNVGIEFSDGRKVVVTYRTYKYKYAKEIQTNMAEYVSANGFVQFDPVEREANGQTVVDYTIKTPGMDGVLIRVTVWPELQGTSIDKGDFIAVDGKLNIGSFTDRNGNSRQSVQISATALAVLPGVQKGEREVVNSGPDTDTPLF